MSQFVHFLEILIFPIRFQLQNFYPRGDILEFDNKYKMSQKGIDEKLLFWRAHSFNSQFLNLFGFSISASFVWCII